MVKAKPPDLTTTTAAGLDSLPLVCCTVSGEGTTESELQLGAPSPECMVTDQRQPVKTKPRKRGG